MATARDCSAWQSPRRSRAAARTPFSTPSASRRALSTSAWATGSSARSRAFQRDTSAIHGEAPAGRVATGDRRRLTWQLRPGRTDFPARTNDTRSGSLALVRHDTDLWSSEYQLDWQAGLVPIPVRMTVIRLGSG